ncbi:FAD-dependent monooxygenase [Streptosporangium sp. DT93]|uniref:FAD-dependent monooxygenase n=1 Tax=Streptosporangium sp. DT93 TaxID=3393428 RepID=UPI003CF66FA8
MTPRRVLISGASIAGLSAAYWLDRAGWRVEIVERAPAFRDGGQNVDVRGVAREVVERMGLTGTVRALTTTEEGTRFVDEAGRAAGEFPAEPGRDGPTAEFEILRGDLAGAVRDRLGPGVGIRYDDSIGHIEQDAAVARVDFASGRHEAYDLVVVAEGVRSSTRERVFGKDVEHVPLGLVMVYGTIEREPADDRWWNWYTAPGRRQVMLRPDNMGTTRAMLAYLTETDEIVDADRGERLAVLNRVFDGAGWQTERVLRGFATSDDVYVDYLTQIKMPRWSEAVSAYSATPPGA